MNCNLVTCTIDHHGFTIRFIFFYLLLHNTIGVLIYALLHRVHIRNPFNLHLDFPKSWFQFGNIGCQGISREKDQEAQTQKRKFLVG